MYGMKLCAAWHSLAAGVYRYTYYFLHRLQYMQHARAVSLSLRLSINTHAIMYDI